MNLAAALHSTRPGRRRPRCGVIPLRWSRWWSWWGSDSWFRRLRAWFLTCRPDSRPPACCGGRGVGLTPTATGLVPARSPVGPVATAASSTDRTRR